MEEPATLDPLPEVVRVLASRDLAATSAMTPITKPIATREKTIVVMSVFQMLETGPNA